MNMAKEFFEKCRYLDRRIDGRVEESQRLRELACKATATYTDVPRSDAGTQSRIEDAVVKLVEVEKEIAANIDEMVEHRKKAQWILAHLSEDRYRDVLTWRYLSQWSWEKIAEAMNCERMQVWRVHGRALLEANTLLSEYREASDRILTRNVNFSIVTE